MFYRKPFKKLLIVLKGTIMNRLLAIRTFLRGLPTHTGLLGAGIFSLILVALLPTSTAFADSHVAAHPESGGGAVVYAHTATATTITNNWTDLDNSVTNNNPQAVVFVTPNWNPGSTMGVYDTHPIGVWYHNGRWAIFNQDRAAMPVGASFNVYALPQANDDDVFVHTATAANSTKYSTTIDRPYSNSQSSAILLVTPNWNPASSSGTYDAHPIGAWYHNGKWHIFNEDQTPIPAGASFNVVVLQHIVQGATVHTAKATNIQANWTVLNNDQANGNHNALVFFTPNMTAQHVFNNHNTGVWFTSQNNWAIFNQDMTAMPVGASFYVVAFSQNLNS
jgi:hypothetical protein